MRTIARRYDRFPALCMCAANDRPQASKEANAAGIVLATALLRVLTDEATVEKLARVIDPEAWVSTDRSSGRGYLERSGKGFGSASQSPSPKPAPSSISSSISHGRKRCEQADLHR